MERNIAESFLVKINITNKNAYAKILWEPSPEDLFSIQVLLDNQSWLGRFSNDNAKVFQKRLLKTNNEYFREVKDALNQDKMYTFQLTSEDSKKGKFSWSKMYKDSTAVFLHGSLDIERETSALTKDDIIDYLLEQNKNLQSSIDECNQRNNIMSMELEKNRDEFKKLVDTKNCLESTLYGKFIQLLNTKKRRIQLLQNDFDNINDQKYNP